MLVILWGVIGGVFGGANVFAGVNDYYIEDFMGDYYLSRAEDGTSRLKVVERITVVLPDYNQNKGICRYIPFTNQNGKNITLPSLTKNDIKVTRNDEEEPIYSIQKVKDYYSVCTGTEEYVLGKQVYAFEYEFEKVVTDFNNYQELYWDTNGTGAPQRFEKVTAKVHFVGDVLNDFTGESWCYVGSYGKSGQDRCTKTKTDDGMEFTAIELSAYENLTFDTELKPNSFVVPELEKNYILIWILVVVGVALALLSILPIKNFIKALPKRKFYKGYFVKPEYQPNDECSVAEMAEIFIGKKKDAKVAVLLDLIVKKKIELSKTGERRKKGWKIKIQDLNGVGDEARILLEILNGGKEVDVGDEIEIKTQTATSALVALGREYNDKVVEELKWKELVEKKYTSGGDKVSVKGVMSFLFTMLIFIGLLVVSIDEQMNKGIGTGEIVGSDVFFKIILTMLLIAIVLWTVLYNMSEKFILRTKKGLEVSRYMDGAKLYIEMAEADRLKMLQSVEGVDTTNEGIVRLYEKMLPYAALLGLEDSWMKELEKYYKLDEVVEPDWYRNGFTVRDIYYASTLASTYSDGSTTMSSGSGGSSSGFSGGGGGGFSGGGGGGGGFGGR